MAIIPQHVACPNGAGQRPYRAVRRVQAGETVTVTVSGRPAARIIPAGRPAWIRWNDIAGLFTADRAAEDWDTDRDRLDSAVADPWAGR